MKTLIAILVLAFAASAFADNDLKDTLKQQYEKHILVLRTPLQKGDQEFDSAGKPLKEPAANQWRAYGPLLITKMKSDSDKLVLEGVRVDSPSLQKPDKKHLLGSGHTVKVEIHLDHPIGSGDELRAVVERVFFLDVKHSDYSLPEYRRADGNAGADETVYHVGKSVSAPVAIYAPDPDYSDKARKGKYQGTTVFTVVVDRTGQVSRIKMVRPLGMGLDEKGVEKIGEWKFKPAQRNGEPVAVEVNIEVTFNLY
jgi:TonB family protein